MEAGTVLLSQADKSIRRALVRTVFTPALTQCSQHPPLFVSSVAGTKDAAVDTHVVLAE